MTENITWFQKIKAGLAKTSDKLSGQINNIFINRKLDEETLEELTDLLIQADLGVKTTDYIINELRKDKFDKNITTDEVKQALATIITQILTPQTLAINFAHIPHVIMVCGVNGNGKTTTIAKMAYDYQNQGKKVLIAGCDTFRAAAIDQLAVWAKRIKCPMVNSVPESDPASVAYQAIEQAQRENYDILLIDTAGRLHNKANLMEELSKIKRVIAKVNPEAPHDIILVLDATTGQNAFRQLEEFQKIIDINGLIITKLDGTAKGGVVVGLAKQYDIKIRAIGVGEGLEDLKAFKPQEFAESLLGL